MLFSSLNQGIQQKYTSQNVLLKRAEELAPILLIDISIEVDIVKPVKELFYHTVAYFKYYTYKKIPIDLWINVCRWLNGSDRSVILEDTIGRVKQYIKYNETLKYPLKEGKMTLNWFNVSINEKLPVLQLLPSGQYRRESTFTDRNRNVIIADAQQYFKILDNRLEQY